MKTKYNIFFSIDKRHNSNNKLQYITENVKLYLEKGKFLKGEELNTKVKVSVIC